MRNPRLIASCACGQVEIEAVGAPISSTICYCDDCQAAAALIEAMPGAPSFREPDGGTFLIVFREDRVRCVRGEANLKKLKLREDSPTNRKLALCCNSVMVLDFDDTKHWSDIYGARVNENVPEPEMLICTRFAAQPPNNVRVLPTYPGYAPRLMIRLVKARIAMLFSR
jgi:hypothetical protein